MKLGEISLPMILVFCSNLVVLVQSSTQNGDIQLIVSGDKLKQEKITISSLK